MSIKELIQGNVTFQYFRNNKLWYKTGNGKMIFPVPVEDIGNATLNREEKGILFMRYIRKWLELCSVSKVSDKSPNEVDLIQKDKSKMPLLLDNENQENQLK